MQAANRISRCRLDRIGNGNQTRQHAVHGQKHHCRALVTVAVGNRGKAGGISAFLRHHRRVADGGAAAIDAAAHALATDRFEIRDGAEGQLLCPSGGKNGGGESVGACSLHGVTQQGGGEGKGGDERVSHGGGGLGK